LDCGAHRYVYIYIYIYYIYIHTHTHTHIYIYIYIYILWRLDPVIDKDLETHNDRTAVAMQQRCKHASTTIELLLGTVFSSRSVPRNYLDENWGNPVETRVLHRRL
jgi:hypothetical protein